MEYKKDLPSFHVIFLQPHLSNVKSPPFCHFSSFFALYPRIINTHASIITQSLSPGVTGAATERPLEGVAEDPTRAGYIKDAHSFEWA